MQQNLHTTISGVVHASQVVSSESSVVAQSAQEVSSGAEEIAETMENLSHGIEKQTHEIAQVGDVMTAFTQNLCETTNQGQQLASISKHVYTLTADGKHLMDSSQAHMQQIHQMMTQSMDKMGELGGRVQEITRFVAIIQTSVTMADVATASERLADLAQQLNTVVKTYKI